MHRCLQRRRRDPVEDEDTAQAFGGKYKGRYLGTLGDIGCVSLDAAWASETASKLNKDLKNLF
jgi:hypothetical protein